MRPVWGRTEDARWTVTSLLLVFTLAAADVILGNDANISGTFLMGPFLAAAMVGPRQTAFVAAAALGLGAAIATVDDASLAGDLVRLTALTAGGGLAVWVSARRERREQALADVTRVADVAQRAILHTVPTQIGEVALASRYLSASREALIGGDLYEVVETEGRVRIVVGDVRGKGLDAVRLAAVVLGTFREAADSAERLVGVAKLMDRRLSRHLEPEDFVTAVLAEFSPGGLVTIVNCGHHPPLHVGSSGYQFVMTTPASTPLGLDPTPVAQEAKLERGDRLLLYTDGLVEARSQSGRMISLDHLVGTLKTSNLEAAISDLVETLQRLTIGPLEDDLALVLAEYRGSPA